MCRGSVPGGPGWRIHPCGRDTWRTIRNPGDREPGEPCPDWQRWHPWDAPTVRRELALGAVCAAQCLARCGDLGIAAVAMVVPDLWGGTAKTVRLSQIGKACS